MKKMDLSSLGVFWLDLSNNKVISRTLNIDSLSLLAGMYKGEISVKFGFLPLEKGRLAVEEPRFGKGSGAKEDSSPAS